MQSHSQATRSGDRMGIKLLLIVIAFSGLFFIWTSWSLKSTNPTHDTWVDTDGKLHVLGITLGETTLRQAEVILKSRSDVALYIYPSERSDAGIRLEAFFPSIADHTKVILLLDADLDLLHAIESRATQPHLYPNTVARMNISGKDFALAQSLRIRQLTLIPSIAIDESMLHTRFGVPTRKRTGQNGSTHLFYPAIGLHAELLKGEPGKLQFRNPDPPEH